VSGRWAVLEHATPTPGQTGQVLDGKYRLDALLAEGGMGAVYRATHVMLGKTIAIKLIRSAIVASPEIVRRFQREALRRPRSIIRTSFRCTTSARRRTVRCTSRWSTSTARASRR